MTGLLLFSVLLSATTEAGSPKGAMFPVPSPDGQFIAFSYYGDIWVVPVEGGMARRLTDSDKYDLLPQWSPDGKWIAFVSNRYGSGDIFVIPKDGSKPPKRLTYHSSWDRLQFWDSRSEFIYFTSLRTEFRGALFRVNIQGGNPRKVIDFGLVDATLIPETDTVLFVRGWTEWWRKRYRGSANWDIWRMDLRSQKPQKITDFEGRDGWPMYSPLTKKIYFLSNQGDKNIVNLWEMELDGSKRKRLTDFDEDIYYPEISYDGRIIVFESMGDIYTHSILDGKLKKIEITVSQDYKTSDVLMEKLEEDATEFALSPDEKELAFVVFGDIFVMELKDGKPGKIRKITDSPEPEKDISWHPEKEEIIFVSLEDGDWDIFRVRPEKKERFYKDFSFSREKILESSRTESHPLYSPDGKKIAFFRDKGTLFVMNKEGEEVRQLYDKNDLLWFDWSPDGRWIAFSRTEMSWREDVYVIPSDGKGEAFNISSHSNDDYKPHWSKDGRRLTFASRNAEGDLWIKYVFLREEDEERDREYWEEMKDSIEIKGPVEIDFDGIEDRIHTVAKFRGGYFWWNQSPDGRVFIIKAEDISGKKDIWTVDWFGENMKRLTKDNVDPKMGIVSRDGEKVYYLSKKGRLKLTEISSLTQTGLPFKVDIEIKRSDLNRVLFSEAWWILKDGFYDPKFHGIDWRAMFEKYYDFALRTRTYWDFHNVVRRMIGELNSSHLGIWRVSRDRRKTGCLGIEYDPDYQGEGVLVKAIVPRSPADKAHLEQGDLILEINGRKIEEGSNYYSYLERKDGEKVRITYLKSGKKRKEVELALIPPSELWTFIYKDWVEGNRKIVEERSNGRFGYIHIRSMSNDALRKFYKDIYGVREKEGLVLDIRYNGGGRIHDELLNFLRRTVYGYSLERGESERDYNTVFRWDKPIVLLINQNCYSDAEIFPMGFKELNLGTVVGTPTFGAVIGTSNITLMDGKTVFRRPSVGWYRLGGQPLENNPIKPDVMVENLPEFDNRPGGPQLERALEILLRM